MSEQRPPSGFYWCYTLDNEGNPLESEGRPIIVIYGAENNKILLHGYDMELDYEPEHYRLLEQLDYSPDNPDDVVRRF